MWKKLVDTEYYILFKTDLEVFVTNYVSLWHLKFSETSFLACLKDSNFGLEMDDNKFVQSGKKMLSHPEGLKTARVSEDSNMLVVQLTMSFGFPLRLEMKLKESSKELFFTMVTQQLLRTVQDLHKSERELRELLKKKDLEIEEYRCEGGDIALRFLKTIPFDACAHSARHPAYTQHVSATDLDSLVHKTVPVPELLVKNVKHEPGVTNGTNAGVKVEHQGEVNKYVGNNSETAVDIGVVKTETMKPEIVSPKPEPGAGSSPGKRPRKKLNL